MSYRRAWEGFVPVVAGLAWLVGAASEGLFAFLVSLVPGALLLTGGVATLQLPGDFRTVQLSALGGVVGAVLALPACLAVGLGEGLFLGLLSAASFVSAGWTSQRREPAVEGVPEPRLDLGLAARVAIDEAMLGTMSTAQHGILEIDLRRVAEEVEQARELYERQGWLEKPAAFHPEPPPLVDPELRPLQVRGVDAEHLSFDSEYEPPADAPGRERWLGYRANRRAHAWVVRADSEPRPWLVCIHGYGMGTARMDLGAFEAERLHRELGLNLILPVLPLHGPRKQGRRSGRGFLGGQMLDTIHAEAQAMWDIRRLLGWVRAQGAPRVGVYGLSLGGYTTALLVGLEDGLACAIAGIPAVDFGRLEHRMATPESRRNLAAAGLDWEALTQLTRVISPLALEPRVPHDRRYIFAGTADRLVPPDQPRDLWRHWGEPEIVWYPGSHMTFARVPKVRDLLRRALGRLAAPA